MIKTLKLVNSWSQLRCNSTTETHLKVNESQEDEIQLKLKYGKNDSQRYKSTHCYCPLYLIL